MDQCQKIKGPENPKQHSNLFSIITFAYTIPLLIKGYRKSLNEEDIPKVLDDHGTTIVGDRLQTYWKQEKLSKKPSLWRAIINAFGAEYMLLGLGLLFDQICLRLMRSIGISLLVKYFAELDGGVSDTRSAYLYGGIIVAASFASIFAYQLLYFPIKIVAMKIRSACASLVYRKALKLSHSAFGKITTGRITNILSNDLRRFDNSLVSAHYLWICPLEILVILFVLYNMVGWISTVGVLFLILLVPLQVFVGQKCSELRRKTAEKTDERIRLMGEIITGIKVIKMYAWEKPFAELVDKIRRLEVQEIRAINHVRGFMKFMMVTSRLAVFSAIVTYVLTGNKITAIYVFTVACFYDNLQTSLTIHFILGITSVSELRTTINRVQELLLAEEKPCTKITGTLTSKKPVVELVELTAKWSKFIPDAALNKVSLNAELGQLVGIIGPVGGGKSTVIQAILDEIHVESGSINVHGKISYASQESWVFTGNIQQNIIFGQALDEARYSEVIKVCALERDFSVLPYGDKTLVGERGITLSGGQKSRINLARAVYRTADIYLLDDPLSAVDMHVGKQIFDLCITQFLRSKCVILITHQLQYLNMLDYIYVVDQGTVIDKGTYDQLKVLTTRLLQNPRKSSKDCVLAQSNSVLEKSVDVSQNANSPEGNKEKRNAGAISKFAYKSYILAGGSLIVCLIAVVAFVLVQVVTTLSDYFIGYWVTEEAKSASSISGITFTYIYTGLVIGFTVLSLIKPYIFFNVSTQISIGIHNKTFTSVLASPLHFFHTNYSGRILNRFSKDIGTIDEAIPLCFYEVTSIMLTVIGIVIIVSIANAWLLCGTVVVVVLSYYLTSVYLATSRSIKRLEGTASSPIFCHLNESMQGLTTIRAFKNEVLLEQEFDNHQDLHSSMWYSYLACSNAYELYTEMVIVTYIAIITFTMIYLQSGLNIGNVGLAITQSIGLLGTLHWGLLQATELENQMTCVERVSEYTKLKPEDQRKSTAPPSRWPVTGSIIFSEVFLRYATEQPFVLKNINISISADQKIGIVGRTGAGKSSLIVALFQLFETEGTILIDGLDIKTIPLQSLRSKISIIPQDPILFSGTVRSNLDPFGMYTDDDLWTTLEDVELKSVVSKLPLGLSHTISDGGANFSVGQKQLICLGRAILRQNKILLLDEATANIDSDTDKLIQNTIKKKFINCTVLTIAHRLNTVMDADKLLVMDAGEVVEFDHPLVLLQNPNGLLYKMALQGGTQMVDLLTKTAQESSAQTKLNIKSR